VGTKNAFSAKAESQAEPNAQRGVSGIVFDAGGLIALERGDRRVLTIADTIFLDRSKVIIPATVLAQVIRNPARQARLGRLLQRKDTELVPLDGSHARFVGLLLAETGTNDIVDAHVVVCARETGFAVVTSDASDLLRLDPSIPIVAV
jgi:hypothetical protein